MNKDLRSHLAARIKGLRSEAGLELRELAEITGYSIATLSMIENNRQGADPDQAEAILNALGSNYLELVTYAYPKYRAKK